MCRNIKILFNFDPPVTAEEIRAASLQYVRKISGSTKPSKANEAAFLAAVEEIAAASTRLLHSMETSAPAKIAKKRQRKRRPAAQSGLFDLRYNKELRQDRNATSFHRR